VVGRVCEISWLLPRVRRAFTDCAIATVAPVATPDLPAVLRKKRSRCRRVLKIGESYPLG
jgi:hypothetical protein